MTNKPLLFFGTEDFSAIIFSRLLEAGYSFKAAVTKPDAKRGRGKKTAPPAVKTVAEKNNIPVLQPEKLEQITDEIAGYGCEFAILAAYGKIIPKSILNMFSGGIINVHPSLLPTYRGPSPIESAILHGDEQTGVSIIKLVEKMDAGPIYAQKEFDLSGQNTKPELYEKLAEIGAELLIKSLPNIFSDELPPKPQDENLATYCPMIKKTDGVIDWQKPAEKIEREIRAYLGWPGSRTQLFGQDVIITEADLNNSSVSSGETKITKTTPVQGQSLYREGGGELFVGAGDNSLKIKKLRPAGRSSMDAEDFLRGRRLV